MSRLRNLVFLLSLCPVLLTAAQKEPDDKYCAKMKDGMIIMMKGETRMAADVLLSNGTRIQVDGIILKKDGTRLVLKEGECVDKDGNLVDTERKEKEEKK